MPSIQFPVLRLTRKSGERVFETGSVYENYDQLASCGIHHIRTQIYEDALVIDSAGEGHKIIKAINPRGKGPFLGYSLLRVRSMQVDLVFNPESLPFPLDDLKDLIIRSVKRDQHFWNESSEVGEIIRKITECESHREVINLLISSFENRGPSQSS